MAIFGRRKTWLAYDANGKVVGAVKARTKGESLAIFKEIVGINELTGWSGKGLYSRKRHDVTTGGDA